MNLPPTLLNRLLDRIEYQISADHLVENAQPHGAIGFVALNK